MHRRTAVVTGGAGFIGSHLVEELTRQGRPVRVFFLIVAPPMEVSNQYLPVLGRIAQLVREPDSPARLLEVNSPDELLRHLDGKGV